SKMTKRNVIECIAIALLAAAILLVQTYANSQEPYYKPRPLTPDYVARLRALNYLPPEEFDYEYKGELTIKRGTQDELRKACPNTFRPNASAIGCTSRSFAGAACVIWIVNDQTLQAIGWDIEIVLRHERAHCNGWHHD